MKKILGLVCLGALSTMTTLAMAEDEEFRNPLRFGNACCAVFGYTGEGGCTKGTEKIEVSDQERKTILALNRATRHQIARTPTNGCERISEVVAKTKELDLSNAGLTTSEYLGIYLSDLTPKNLVNLDLRGNQISDISYLGYPSTINDTLQTIDVSGNRIESLVGLDRLTKLEFVNARSNPGLSDVTSMEDKNGIVFVGETPLEGKNGEPPQCPSNVRCAN